MVGALAAFLIWFIDKHHTKKNAYKENLNFVEKVIIDRINNAYEARVSVLVFLDDKIQKILRDIDSSPPEQHFVSQAFFPLFSMRSIGPEIHKISTGSGYVDSKIDRAFSISDDLVRIVDDSRRQFESTLELNQTLVLGKYNTAAAEKASLRACLVEYEHVTRRDLAERNLLTYLRVLIQTQVAITELKRIGIRKWRKKFSPKSPTRFLWWGRKEPSSLDIELNWERIEKCFEEEVNMQMARMNMSPL
jgi:hypothetical protein